MRVLIVCGGTGGHFYPGLVLGRILRGRGHEILFALRREDPAGPRLDSEDFPYVEIDLQGMPRGLSRRWLTFPGKVLGSFLLARNILRAYHPNVVVGMGGYLTFPLTLAARCRRIPYLLHESNSILGLANRLMAGGARYLALGLPLLDQARPTETVLTGTPIREELAQPLSASKARRELALDTDRHTLLVFGGSQGAAGLNRIVPQGVVLYARAHPGTLQVVHLSGAKDERAVRGAYAQGGETLKWTVLAYTAGMAAAYGAADLVLSRAGASTLSELIAQRKPAVLVPFPFAAADHQAVNARILQNVGAARMIRESELSPAWLCRELENLLGDSAILAAMAESYAGLSLPDSGTSGTALADLVENCASCGPVEGV